MILSGATPIVLPVSVVIPVRNESSNLGEMFDSLIALSAKPAEVVFVDTGSTDGSAEHVERWMEYALSEGIRCHLCHRPGAYPGAARNAGIEAATQPWVAFLDAGIAPRTDWLEKLWSCQRQYDVPGVYGSCHFHSEHPFGRMICAISYGQGRTAPVLPASLFRKDVFEKSGYFEEQLRSGEDILWNQGIVDAGVSTKTCHDAIVEYRHFPDTLWRALTKWFVYEQSATVAGIGNARKSLMLLVIALIYAMTALSVQGALVGMVAYFAFRGVVEPFRRSADKPWWRHWWQPFAMIPTAILLDIASMAGRMIAWMGFSKFQLNTVCADSPPTRQLPANQRRIGVLLWFAFFSFSTLVALLVQKVLLPRQTALHAGNGLLIGDSQFFHAAAARLAEDISVHGWGVWRLFPELNAYGNVGILGAIYAFLGLDPSFAIPLNAGLHALSGVIIYLIISAIGGGTRTSIGAGGISAMLFVVFPSALNWYGQLHKDGYAIAGTLIILWTWLMIFLKPLGQRQAIWLFSSQLVGFLLIGCARPYALKLLLPITMGTMALLLAAPEQSADHHPERFKKIGFFCLSLVANWLCIAYFSQLLSAWGNSSLQSGGENYASWVSTKGWVWQHTSWVLPQIDAYFEILAKTRAALIDFGIAEGARSMIDIDQIPNNLYSMLAYIPRAVQIALFAPFPSSWLKEPGLLNLVATAEMSIIYLGFAGFPFLLWRKNRFPFLIPLFLAISFLAIYGFTIANLGTLYRLRYVFLMLIVSLGLLGWATIIERHWKRRPRDSKVPKMSIREDLSQTLDSRSDRLGVIGNSLSVLCLTFLGFVGFFLRDMLLANRFGLTAELDDFYLALLLPMFVVSILSIPLGNAFTPVYLMSLERGGSRLAAALVSATARRVTLTLGVICIVLFVSTPTLLPLLRLHGAEQIAFMLHPVFYLALPILLLSGALVLGNAILNAHGNFRASTSAQLLVPACSIALFLVFGDQGVNGAMLGMLLGQVFNLLVVQHQVRRYGVLLNMQDSPVPIARENSELLVQYLPLLASALFVSLIAPVSTLLAMQLPEGSITALNLGSKVVMFINGLLSAAFNAVMLPYFSSLVARDHLFYARRELSFYILLSVFISVPVTVFLFFWAKPLITIIVPAGNLNAEDFSVIANVMQYGVLQLPFFVTNILLLKFAIATRHVMAIWGAAILGLMVNTIAGITLMNYMGIAGIALGSSLAMVASTALLFAVLMGNRHVAVNDAITIGLNWLLFLTLILCLHFRNPLGIGVCMLGYGIIFFDYMRSIRPKAYALENDISRAP